MHNRIILIGENMRVKAGSRFNRPTYCLDNLPEVAIQPTGGLRSGNAAYRGLQLGVYNLQKLVRSI